MTIEPEFVSLVFDYGEKFMYGLIGEYSIVLTIDNFPNVQPIRIRMGEEDTTICQGNAVLQENGQQIYTCELSVENFNGPLIEGENVVTAILLQYTATDDLVESTNDSYTLTNTFELEPEFTMTHTFGTAKSLDKLALSEDIEHSITVTMLNFKTTNLY